MSEQYEIKLTTDEILKHQFKQARKGYDTSEVDNYLDSVIDDYESFQDIITNLQRQNSELKRQLADKAHRSDVQNESVQPLEDENQPSTNFDIIQRLSILERKVFTIEQALNKND